MKVLFLDIDGVLNHSEWYSSGRNPGNLDGNEGDIDPQCAGRVASVCRRTGAKIVVSSDWRISWASTQARLSRMGLGSDVVIGCTPDHTMLRMFRGVDASRGGEVEEWLQSHPECEEYVIVDDRTDFTDEQKQHMVTVDSEIGITDDDVEMAVAILGEI